MSVKEKNKSVQLPDTTATLIVGNKVVTQTDVSCIVKDKRESEK